MGTRSLTHVLDDHSEAVLVTIYRQMDGYPSGQGQDLVDLMLGRRLVNGYGVGDTEDVASNGIGCFAATLIKALKGESGIGGIYIVAPGSTGHDEEYVYTIRAVPGKDSSRATGGFRLKIEAEGQTLFEGDPAEFDAAAIGR